MANVSKDGNDDLERQKRIEKSPPVDPNKLKNSGYGKDKSK